MLTQIFLLEQICECLSFQLPEDAIKDWAGGAAWPLPIGHSEVHPKQHVPAR